MAYILWSKLSLKGYPTIMNKEEISHWLIGDWKSLDPIFAGRLAAYAKFKGKPITLSETLRSTALQTMYYKEYLSYKRTGKLGPHGIKLAAAPGSSSHEYHLAADVRRGHSIYEADNKELKAFGLCKPLLAKGEFWHIQPIETNTTKSSVFVNYCPEDLASKLVAKFKFDEITLLYIQEYQWGVDFAKGLLDGKKDFADETIAYFEGYTYWVSLQKIINIY